MPNYMARIEFEPFTNIRAINVYMQADNILQAGNIIMTYFGSLGIDESNVKRLVEQEEK